jgi:tripartite-type tricarboxylate transporter receptor subunit TctC
MTSRIRSALLVLPVVLAWFPAAGWAQDAYPSRPIRLVVTFAPGGITDVTARALAEGMRTKLGQPVVIDNRPGASGRIGSELVATSAPDGYTLLMVTPSTTTVLAAIDPTLPYDPEKSFAPVAHVASATFFLVVNPELPAKSTSELIALARAKPGALNYGSLGPGSAPHLITEMFKRAAGIELVHVPYKGEPLALADLLGNRIQVLFMAAAKPHVEAGKVRALATTALEPWFTLPDVPPLDKAGLPGFQFIGWNGMVAPAGTPRQIVEKVNAAVNVALEDPTARRILTDNGFKPVGGPPEAMATVIRDDLAALRKLFREAQLKF